MVAYRFADLPVDTVIAITQKLNCADVLSLDATCRDLHRIVSSDCVWIDRCGTWKDEIDLEKWLPQAQSGKTLFRLLNTFNDMIGTWTVNHLKAEGSLVFVTWDNFSLMGLNVDPKKLKFIPLFKVLGNSDGSTTTQLLSTKSSKCVSKASKWSVITTSGECVSAAFRWSTSLKDEFYLDVKMEDVKMENEESGSGTLVQHLRERGFAVAGHKQIELHLDTIGDFVRWIIMLSAENRQTNNQQIETSNSFRCSYRKLVVETRKPFVDLSGLWTGTYGPHGSEIISVTYDDRRIIATKVTGDANVPSGQVSFIAALDSETSEMTPTLQGLVGAIDRRHVNVVKVYTGKGRVAEMNFVNPKWVKGDLMVDESGETMGFFFEDNVNFLIWFRRLDVKSLYNGGQQVLA